MNAGVDRNPTPKTIALSIRCIKDIGVGVGKMEERQINVYPNPATRIITIELPEGTEAGLSVFNPQGVLVLSQKVGNNSNQVDLGMLAKGIYLMTLKGDSWLAEKKLIKN